MREPSQYSIGVQGEVVLLSRSPGYFILFCSALRVESGNSSDDFESKSLEMAFYVELCGHLADSSSRHCAPNRFSGASTWLMFSAQLQYLFLALLQEQAFGRHN